MPLQQISQTTKRKSRALAPGKIGIFFVAIGTILLILTMAFPVPIAAHSERRQVLFINSYHVGYKFSDDITRAIREAFDKVGNIELRVEYLDTKRLDSPEYLEQIRLLYQAKYKKTDLDLIISSDDAALNFLFQHADSLFPEVPVVFVGANFFDVARLQGYERFTGVSEEADIAGTIEIAIHLQPEVKRIVVVNDTTVAGQIIRRTFDEVIPQYPQITFEFLDNASMTEVQQRVSTLTPDSLVLLTIFSRDKDGIFYEYDQFTPLIAQSSAVPVFAAWDFSLGYGIVGGKLTSGYIEGQRAAALAIRILNGENPRDVPVEKKSQAQYMFEYNALEKWDIPLSRLPKESFILGRPISFYEQNLTLVWGVTIGFFVLLFVVAILLFNNNQRRIAQRKLADSNKELLEFQVTLEKQIANRTQALTTSAEISRQLSSIREQDKLVSAVVEQLKSGFNYYHAHMYLLSEDKQRLILAGGTGEAGKILLEREHSLPLGRGLVGRTTESKEAVLVPNTRKSPDWLPNPLLPDTQAEIAVPIIFGGQVLGVLDVQNDIANSLSQQDADLIRAIADQVGIALENIRASAGITKRIAELQSVADISVAISSIQDIQEMLETMVHLTQRRFNLYHCHVFLYEKNSDHLAIVACGYKEGAEHEGTHGTTTVPLSQEQSLVARAARTRQPIIVNDVRTDPGWLPNPLLPDTAAELAVPMIVGEQLIGVLDVQAERAGAFTQEDASIQVTLALHVAIAVQNALSLNQNREQARRETTLNLISQKIQNTTSIEQALQITARELGQALGKKPTLVSLNSSEKIPNQQ